MDRCRSTTTRSTTALSRLPAPRRPALRRLALAVPVALALLLLAGCSGGGGTDDTDFTDLTTGTRVYDETGDSLTSDETTELQQRLDTLEAETGADVIAYVRELDADPDETLDQVEALQQAWVAATGTDQDTAGAILVNREPGTDDEARAGIFVGTTYDDGNVPRDEQEAIVEDELVPPLRDGDVAASLTAGIDRLGSSIRNGPPTNALDDLAAGAGSSWLPWTGLALALIGLLGVALVFRGRARPTRPEQPPTTVRPDQDTDPAIATALVHGGAQASAVPAAVLALAARDALVIEQEKEPRWGSKGTVQVRLLDAGQVRGPVEQAVWGMLAERAEDGLVPSAGLKRTAGGPGATKSVVQDRLRSNGWLAAGTARARLALVALAVLGGLVAIGGIVVASGGAPLMLVAIIPAGLLLAAGVVTAIAYSRLSVAGRDAARPWEAYRDGLEAAGKEADRQADTRADTARSDAVDLDAALPDIVALGLVPTFAEQLDAATDPGSATTLRAFAAPAGSTYAAQQAAFPWGAFAGVYASSSGAGGAVSGGGAGGGGGAAGST